MSITQVQQMLVDAGFNPGKVDGVWGNATRSALATALDLARSGRPAPPVSGALRNAIAVDQIIADGLQLLVPAIPATEEARVLLLAYSGQEADFHHRWQVFDRARPTAMGAARGLWQFERGGAVRGVLTHARTRTMAAVLCRMRGLPATIDAVYNALHQDDLLAAAFARLNLWWHPSPLPAVGDVDGAWKLYIDAWRPGAYWNAGVTTAQREALRAKFAGYYNIALQARKAA